MLCISFIIQEGVCWVDGFRFSFPIYLKSNLCHSNQNKTQKLMIPVISTRSGIQILYLGKREHWYWICT